MWMKTRRKIATAALIQKTAVSHRMRNVVIGPCVETKEPLGAGKKNSAITLSSTITAVCRLANRISIAGPKANFKGPEHDPNRMGEFLSGHDIY